MPTPFGCRIGKGLQHGAAEFLAVRREAMLLVGLRRADDQRLGAEEQFEVFGDCLRTDAALFNVKRMRPAASTGAKRIDAAQAVVEKRARRALPPGLVASAMGNMFLQARDASGKPLGRFLPQLPHDAEDFHRKGFDAGAAAVVAADFAVRPDSALGAAGDDLVDTALHDGDEADDGIDVGMRGELSRGGALDVGDGKLERGAFLVAQRGDRADSPDRVTATSA